MTWLLLRHERRPTCTTRGCSKAVLAHAGVEWSGSDRQDIGEGHAITFYTFYTHHAGGLRAGLIDWHSKPDGSECKGSILFDTPENVDISDKAKWQVVSMDPLHLEPSLLCRTCGDHGWIRNGKWVKA